LKKGASRSSQAQSCSVAPMRCSPNSASSALHESRLRHSSRGSGRVLRHPPALRRHG